MPINIHCVNNIVQIELVSDRVLFVDHPYFAKHEIYFETLISNSFEL